jgi:hypothetical protein
VFVEKDGQYYRIGSGYMPLAELEARFLEVKRKLD